MPNKRVIMPAITFFPPLRKTGSKCELFAPIFNIRQTPNHLATLNPVFACQQRQQWKNQRTHQTTLWLGCSIMNESLVYKLLLISFAKILQWFSRAHQLHARWQIESKNDNCLGFTQIFVASINMGPSFITKCTT